MTADDQVRLIAQLKSDEGCVLYAYTDSSPLHLITIGYGRLLDQRKGGGISEYEAEFLLANDLKKVEIGLAPFDWFQIQDSVRQAALTMMSYNLGITGLLHFPQFLLHMGKQEYPEAVAQLVGTPWHNEVGARAVRIESMISTGAWP